jgi:hypothetical protein
MAKFRITNTNDNSVELALENTVLANVKQGEFIAKTVATVANLMSTPTVGALNVLNYHSGIEGGGGVFYWDSTKLKSEHNGGTVIDPSKVFPSDWNNQVQLTSWFDGSNTGSGCWVRQYDGAVNVKWFGAREGASNSLIQVQKAVVVAKNESGSLYFPKGTYTIYGGSVVLLSYLEINFNYSTLYGSGTDSDIPMFVTGYLLNGVPTSNIGSPIESKLVTSLSVKNGYILNAGMAFYFYNAISNCHISDFEITNCGQVLNLFRCFYAQVENVVSRNYSNDKDEFGFIFDQAVNVLSIKNVSCNGRRKGILLKDNANGQKLFNVTAEGCEIGIRVQAGSLGPLEFDTCYIEGCSLIGIDFSNGQGKDPITITNCWFYGNGTAIDLDEYGSYTSVFIDSSNEFLNNTINVIGYDTSTEGSMLSLRPTQVRSNMSPSIPSGFQLTRSTLVDAPQYYQRAVDYRQECIGNTRINTFIPFNSSGDGGFETLGEVPFCVHSKSSGTTGFTVYLDTKITYRVTSVFTFYKIYIQTDQTAISYFGNTYGANIKELHAPTATYPVVLTNNLGYVRFEFRNIPASNGVYQIYGYVKAI